MKNTITHFDLKAMQNNAALPISREERFLKKVKDCIMLNLDKPYYSVQDLAKSVHLSVSQLNRRLNALSKQPAGKMIRAFRLQYAAQLLIQDTLSINEIAYKTGYDDPAHFCRSFKQIYQCTPSQYRKRNS